MTRWFVAALLVALPATARGEGDRNELASDLAADAAFTPGVFRANERGNGFLSAATTLDGTRDARVQVDALGEVHLFGPVRVVVRIADVLRDTAKPGIGAGVQFLREGKHPVSASAYLQYKPEGFTEPEGELELVLSFGKRFGRVSTALNLAYGQDPEANERDGEVAAVAHVELVPNVMAGATVRYRDALGSMKEPVVRDAFGGAIGTFSFARRFAVTAAAGLQMLELRGLPRDVGLAATVAIGAGF